VDCLQNWFSFVFQGFGEVKGLKSEFLGGAVWGDAKSSLQVRGWDIFSFFFAGGVFGLFSGLKFSPWFAGGIVFGIRACGGT
jgi:hypothetical protein